jgi:hypothetical protein
VIEVEDRFVVVVDIGCGAPVTVVVLSLPELVPS